MISGFETGDFVILSYWEEKGNFWDFKVVSGLGEMVKSSAGGNATKANPAEFFSEKSGGDGERLWSRGWKEEGQVIAGGGGVVGTGGIHQREEYQSGGLLSTNVASANIEGRKRHILRVFRGC